MLDGWYNSGPDFSANSYGNRRATTAAMPPRTASQTSGGGAGPRPDITQSPLSISELDMTDQLAAYVLGTSNAFAKQRAAGKSPLSPPGTDDPGGKDKGGPSAEDGGIDFSAQPQQFRVRGLLSLPPLKVPQGQQLPAVRFTALSHPALQRPTTASTTSSRM